MCKIRCCIHIPPTLDSKTEQARKFQTLPTEKSSELRRLMRQMGNVLVAYSGGVDSSYLAYVANDELGEKAECILGLSPSVSKFQKNEPFQRPKVSGLNFETINTDEIENEHYSANPANRCYFCKSELYEKLPLSPLSAAIRICVDGTNADDLARSDPGEWPHRRNWSAVRLRRWV